MTGYGQRKGRHGCGMVIVQPIERGMVSMLNEQDGLYTLILRGQVDGKPSKDGRIIQSIKRGLSPYEDFEGYLALAHNPDMRIIISNTTEAGIVYTGKDSFDDKPQASYPGKLTRLLYERFTAFGGKKGTGFILLPCELIDYNGRNLEECCMKTAEQWGLSEEFKTWLKTENVFCSTLVDRIVTGYPRGEAESLRKFGYRDNMLDTAEPFGLWVIEGPAWIENELPFKKAGCNVVFTQDVSPYKLRKVRMLNGAHTSMVLGAYLAGHEIVGDCMADDTMRSYMSQALFNEIMPTLDLPKDDLEAFASAIFERFSNPFNRHLLLSIALNSQSKFRARVLPTIKEYVKRKHALPKILTFSMAAFIAFYCGKKEDGSFVGVRAAGNEYPIADDRSCRFLRGHDRQAVREIARAVLTSVVFWAAT
ncbi:MAG: tagaturonate reductase [Christensenellales bacterium]